MCLNRTIVLKFGGSVLRSSDDLYIAAQEIYGWHRLGYKVVAVVSAFFGKTDELLRQVSTFGEEASSLTIAKLVGAAERESSALLGLALDQCGVPNQVLLETDTGLLTCGNPLNASPTNLDCQRLNGILDQGEVVLTPGFVGRDQKGNVNLLGRGGSDLTAMFVAHRLNARCRLIKDVDGLYEFDPKTAEMTPGRYEQLCWNDALKLDESIVQHKAIHFARDNGVEFEVAAANSAFQTVTGDIKTRLAEPAQSDHKIRVGLLGLGTVGKGVLQQLARIPSQFEVTALAVRNPEKHLADPELVSQDINLRLTGNWRDVIESDCHVVVELIGGTDVAREAVEAALAAGKYLVTGNKALLAQGLEEGTNGQAVRFSAAVGGGVPALEFVSRIQATSRISRICGCLNGTTSFILGQIANGLSFGQAVELAQEKGLSEADPARDINGVDAAEKLVLLASAAGVEIGVNDVTIHEFDFGSPEISGRSFQQIATLEIRDGSLVADVRVVEVGDGSLVQNRDPFLALNSIEIETEDAEPVTLHGLGAGCWPTTLSVVSDIIDTANSIRRTRVATIDPQAHAGQLGKHDSESTSPDSGFLATTS